MGPVLERKKQANVETVVGHVKSDNPITNECELTTVIVSGANNGQRFRTVGAR